MTLRLQSTDMDSITIISALNNFRLNAGQTLDAPGGFTEEQIVAAIASFPAIKLLGGTAMTVDTYDTDRNNIADDADTVAGAVSGAITSHLAAFNHGNIAHTNRAVLDALIAIPVTEVKFVDNTRTDSYTEDGSEMKPFKTIQAAIDSIADASNSKKYMIEIKAGAYTEDLTFKPYVELKGESKETTKVTGTHGCVFSTGGRLEVRDITIRGTITFDKPTGTVPGVSIWIANVWADSIVANFKGTVDYLQITNDCLISGNITHHSSHVLVRDSLVYGNIVTDDQDLEVPDPVYGDSGTRNISGCGCNNITVRGNSWLEIHDGHTWGSLTSDGASAYLNYDVVSAPENPANVIVLNSGNVDLMSHASALSNDSSVSGNSVKDALNNCVTKNAINGSFTTVDGKTITVVDGQITSIV